MLNLDVLNSTASMFSKVKTNFDSIDSFILRFKPDACRPVFYFPDTVSVFFCTVSVCLLSRTFPSDSPFFGQSSVPFFERSRRPFFGNDDNKG